MNPLVSLQHGTGVPKGLLVLCCFAIFQSAFAIDDEMMAALVKGVKIRKCSCLANEYLSNADCLQKDTEIPLLISTDIEAMWVSTSIFDSVQVRKLHCPVESSPVTLQPLDLLVVALTGELYHGPTNHTFSLEEYCLEHVQNDEGAIAWEVQVCLQPPTIQVCCSQEKVSSGECESPLPPMRYGSSLMKDPDVNFVYQPLQCEDDQVIESVRVAHSYSYSVAYISYEAASAVLLDYSGFRKGLGGRYLAADQYCINPKHSQAEAFTEASFCIPDPLKSHHEACEGFACVRKCCPEGMLHNTEQQSCIPYDAKMLWKPKFQTKNGSKTEPSDNIKMTYGHPICKIGFYSFNPTEEQDDLFLLSTGELITENTGHLVSWQSWQYCLENFLDPTNHIQETALLCYPEEEEPLSRCSKAKELLIPTLLILSCVFLAITLIVYAVIPELHAKLHGKSLLSHVTALMSAYLFLTTIKLGSSVLSMPVCRSFAFALQISFLASFFWLNVMCFDIWWALRSMRPVAETSSTSRRRFLYYSLYAWGCPLVIGTVTLTMEVLPNPGQYGLVVLPEFGRTKCWFGDNLSLWVYFYGFVCILTVTNIILFISVAVILLKAQRSNHDILKFTRQQHKERIWIYLKLFVVMGITWICEILSFEEGSCEYWLFTDIINALQGFFIFLIFICKRNVWEKLKGKWNNQKKRKPGSSASDGSSSRSTLQSTLESSTRKLSTLHYHLSRFQRDTIKEEPKEPSST